MSPTQRKRLLLVSTIVLGMGTAIGLALKAIDSSIELFLTPSEVKATEIDKNAVYKVAGIVRQGSVQTLADDVTKQFVVTDCEHDVVIRYAGLLPDLFREGQAIISAGKFTDTDTLTAHQVLAKHDENYVPKEAAQAMMQAQASRCDKAQGAIAI